MPILSKQEVGVLIFYSIYLPPFTPWRFEKKIKPNPSFHPPSDSDSSLDTVATPERIAFNFNSRLKGSLSPTDRFWQPTKINDIRLNIEDGRHFNTHALYAIDSCEEFAVYFLLVKGLGPEHVVERYFASDIDLWYLDRIYWGLHLNIVGC
ncbi:hypothetical protein TNIN_143001 [Trichonephila inaurata madagascariensis]|uniref:Uncharacterized protein n=1 Tax=Trichonephila inaurata madagascariensis TaxID=2747483 RepID=A0A8X6IUB7_9ARAC|nr:hypothetical protein TNIN_143001 [Trichonephila inaurata madagascariensis]